MTTFTLPNLPFAKDALAPYMSKETLEFHHDKHHQTYVNNLNNLLKDSPLNGKSLEEIIKQAQGGLYNNAAQTYNHTFFWNCLKPQGGGKPNGALADAINKKWGDFDKFKAEFSASAAANFGSGWTWLVKNSDGNLEILNMGAAGNPLTENGKTPILCIDVWEHAYYVDYRNARPKFIEAFLNNLVNWDFAEKNFAA